VVVGQDHLVLAISRSVLPYVRHLGGRIMSMKSPRAVQVM
jgi:hypothetical protein